MLAGRPYLRRVVIVLIGAAAALLTTLIVPPLSKSLGYQQVTWQRALWTMLSFEMVFAVYKWGVGSWSRYTPPPQSTLRRMEPPAKQQENPNPESEPGTRNPEPGTLNPEP